MTTQIPRTMRAIALTKYCKPTEYQLATLPVPTISKPDELLIKVKAASVNPVDVKMASGIGKLMGANKKWPKKIGHDLSGVVVAVGTSVSNFKVGDEVYARLPDDLEGTLAEYCLSIAGVTALKPKSLSFGEAASIPLASLTALRSLQIANDKLEGGLKGKTVFIPAGLSGTGVSAIQLAKNAFGAGKVITTLSPGKIAKVGEYLGHAMPDQMIDYTKENVGKEVGNGNVDFMFDTMAATLSSLSLLKRGGVIVSISTMPNGTEFNKVHPGIPFWLRCILNVFDWFVKAWTKRKGIYYQYMAMPSGTAELDLLTGFIEEGKLKPVVGRKTMLSDIEGVRAGCQQIYEAKGGIGKFVVEID